MNPTAATFSTENLRWVIAESRSVDYTYELRFCVIPSNFARSRYPIRLNVFWSMAAPRTDGLASAQDVARMHVFEQRLVGTIERGQIAVLPLVLTGRGEREFVFYARSSDEFMEALRQMPQEDDRYPIEIHRTEDPDWNYYDYEIQSVRPPSA